MLGDEPNTYKHALSGRQAVGQEHLSREHPDIQWIRKCLCGRHWRIRRNDPVRTPANLKDSYPGKARFAVIDPVMMSVV